MTTPAALRIRPVDGDLIGTTAFFRNRAFLGQIGREIAALSRPGQPVEILVHACSVGAEVYSLAIHLTLAHPEVDFRITATDISEFFVRYAAKGVYPAVIMDRLTSAERAFFKPDVDGVALIPPARSRITFAPPASFVDYTPKATFEVVSLCNALVYVPADGQTQAIRRIAGYNTGLLAVTGGHEKSIADDLSQGGYEAILNEFAAIHAGWTDRQRPPAWRPDMPRPPHIHADPYLGPIDDAPGWQYRHGALFRKAAAAAAA